jgi:hypothetical protein
MMLFDPTLDALFTIRKQLNLSQHFLNFGQVDSAIRESGRSTQPILYAPYELFLLIADATKLARIPCVLSHVEISTWLRIQHELRDCPQTLYAEDDLLAALYAFSIQMLLLKSNPYFTSDEKNRQTESSLHVGLNHVPLLNLDHHFPSYLLWPLAILGSVCITLEEQKIVQNCIYLVSITKPGGQARWVQTRLTNIWSAISNKKEGDPGKCRLLGLQVLLDGEEQLN